MRYAAVSDASLTLSFVLLYEIRLGVLLDWTQGDRLGCDFKETSLNVKFADFRGFQPFLEL